MKKVYMIMIDEWSDGYCSTQVPAIHETLEGAKLHFREIVWNETVHFIRNEFASDDISEEFQRENGIIKRTGEHSDGTLSFSIEGGLRTVYVHIYERDLRP